MNFKLEGVDFIYQVLYRKYRPVTFLDVVGQDQVTQTLKNEIKSGRIAHAYLFTGSRGTGKTTCAKILARAVNCLSNINDELITPNSNKGDPCGVCEICKGFSVGTITDIVEMDAASNNGVGDVRDLQEALAFTPAKTKYRVYIIDEVHMMSGAAFNALLKTLEEPPAHVVFILATTEAHKLPATILSRCQRFDFYRISAEVIAARLIEVAVAENAEITHEAAMLIARISDGGMRDALSLLDQCISRGKVQEARIKNGTDNDDHVINEETVRDAAGMAGSEHIFALSSAIADGDAEPLLNLLDGLHQKSKDMMRLCEELISHFRGIMIINTVKRPEKLIIATKGEMERLLEIAKKYSVRRCMDILDALLTSLERMGRGAVRRTELETTLIRLCRQPDEDESPDKDRLIVSKLEARVAELEKQIKQGIKIAVPMQQNQNMNQSTKPPPMPATEINRLSDEAKPFEKWGEVMSALESRSPSLFAVLRGSQACISGDFILVDTSDMGVDMLRQDTARVTLKGIISEQFGKDYKLGPYRPSKPHEDKPPEGIDLIRQRAEEAGVLG